MTKIVGRPIKLEHGLLVRKLRMLGKSDGGSAFKKFQPGYRQIRGSGDPLIEPLIFGGQKAKSQEPDH